VTTLKKLPEEVGSIDFPDVLDLLDYWMDFPPEHLLLRALTGYEPDEKAKKAKQMDDREYRPARARRSSAPSNAKAEELLQQQGTHGALGARQGARHKTAAPPHIQQAIERAKRGTLMEIPPPSPEE